MSKILAQSPVAFFDCFSGISGDMCLGALVHAGVPLGKIRHQLASMPVEGFSLAKRTVTRSHLAATKIDVILSKKSSRGAKKWSDIQRIIGLSSFSSDIKAKGMQIFRTLFEAEAAVHGKKLHTAHLHELGAIDCLVDVFGTLIGLELLGIREIFSSPVNLGSGVVNTAHGILPVPSPATAQILRNTPVYQSDAGIELTTPTGAAILRVLAGHFGEMPCMLPEKIGLGAGNREIPGRPNVLRISIGPVYKNSGSPTVTVIETNIDDMNPQLYEYLFDELLGAGALDVFMTGVTMKKMRPGTKLTVVCSEDRRDALIRTILRETTSIGIRYHETPRVIMDREIREVSTRFGKIRTKIASFGDIVKDTPEYEDCKKMARKSGRPLLEIMEEAKIASRKK